MNSFINLIYINKSNCSFPASSLKNWGKLEENETITKLHSSRMRTARTLTVSPSMFRHGEGGCLLWGRGVGVCSRGVGCLLRGVSAPGGVCSWGCLLPGVSAPGVSTPRESALGGCLLGGCLLQGSAPRGVCSRGYLLWEGVCSGGVCSQRVCLLGGVSAWGCLLLGGGGCVIPACTEADTPPVNRITDACKNITLPQLRCGR